jgi:hypothetical protein
MRNFVKCAFCHILLGVTESRRIRSVRILRRHRHRWEDNIKMYLKEIEWEVMDWIHLAQDRDWWLVLKSTVMNL